MKQKTLFKISWFFVIITAVLIFWISTLTFPPGKGVGPSYLSIVYHFFAFFWLSFFLHSALVSKNKISFILIAIIIAMFYAITDEIHQSFVYGRVSCFSDWVIDSLGILTASLIYILTVPESS